MFIIHYRIGGGFSEARLKPPGAQAPMFIYTPRALSRGFIFCGGCDSLCLIFHSF
jgi:hypothetical protein